MARLPQPGGDSSKWGDILNDYLLKSHTPTGELQQDTVGFTQLMDNAVVDSALAPDAVTTSKIQDAAVTQSKVDSTVRASLAKADTATQPADLATKYTKPSDGIPLSDIKRSELNSAYVIFPGNRAVVIGNSIDISNEAPASNSHNSSWFNYASIISGQRFEYGYNAGVAGDTTAQMLARFDADVAPQRPRVVVIGGAENDADPSRGVSLGQYAANMDALVAKLRAINASVVLRTTLCNNATGTRRSSIAAMNAWIRTNASRLGALCVLDFYGLLADPATGGYRPAYDSGDGTHPNDLGNSILGAYAAKILAPLLPENGNFLAQSNADGANLLTNGLFLGPLNGGNSDQVNGWYTDQSPSVRTVSLVAGQFGNWYTMDFNNSSQAVNMNHYDAGSGVPAASLAGHELIYCMRIKSTLTAGMLGSVEIAADATPFQLSRGAYNMAGDISDEVITVRFTVGTGASVVNVAYKIPAGVTGRVAFA